jgi:hypothetical protein
MLEKKVMQTVFKTVNELGIPMASSDVKEQLPYETCVVDFGLDNKQRPISVQILHYSQDTITKLYEVDAEPNPANLSILSFIMTLPIEIPQKTTGEVLRLICLANKSIPLGGLNFSEIEKSVYYTYSIPIFQDPPSAVTLLTILQTATFVKETYLSVIDEVAVGTTTVNKILE